MKFPFIVSLILIGIVGSYANQSKLKNYPRPALEENAPGLDKTACVALDAAARICQGLIDDDNGGAKVIVQRSDETVGEWKSEVFLGDATDFKVFSGDLDNDGQIELIVANRTAVSNGMGVNYWTLAILPFPVGAEELQPVQFQTEDFSVSAMFVPRRRSGGFDILTTDWETLPIKNPGNRTALYFVGRWSSYQNGTLTPIDRPILVRRYLFIFERERLKNINNKNDNYSGFNSPAVEKRDVEPLTNLFVEAETEATAEDVIFNVNSENPAVSFNIFVRTSAGETSVLTYSANAGEPENTFDFIGDFALRRLYPKGYLPDLKGKTVKLTNYAASKNEPLLSRVLWLTN